MTTATVICTNPKCRATIGELEVFPGGLCLKCHAEKWDRVPLSHLPPPDFVGAIRGVKRRKKAK